MRSIVTFIAVTAFMLHFLWGCCAHHVHANDRAASLNLAQAAGHCHGSGGHESPDPCGQLPDDSNSQCPGQHTSDCHCIFMAAGKMSVAKAVFQAALPVADELTSSSELTSSLAAAAIDSGGLIKLPVRIHLFHQVMLI
jgi:hypothetical protein